MLGCLRWLAFGFICLVIIVWIIDNAAAGFIWVINGGWVIAFPVAAVLAGGVWWLLKPDPAATDKEEEKELLKPDPPYRSSLDNEYVNHHFTDREADLKELRHIGDVYSLNDSAQEFVKKRVNEGMVTAAPVPEGHEVVKTLGEVRGYFILTREQTWDMPGAPLPTGNEEVIISGEDYTFYLETPFPPPPLKPRMDMLASAYFIGGNAVINVSSALEPYRDYNRWTAEVYTGKAIVCRGEAALVKKIP